jgi:hypothetical protein
MEAKMNRSKAILALLPLLLAACSTQMTSSEKAAGVTPVDPTGLKVAAVVMMSDQQVRQNAEDALAREISKRGYATGIPMYRIMPDAKPDNEAAARAALQQAGVDGLVVMRPEPVQKDTVLMKPDPMYEGYFGGYYTYGWNTPYMEDTRTQTTVTVETRVYSLKQNKLLWKGRSQSVDPKNLNSLVSSLTNAVGAELTSKGVLTRRAMDTGNLPGGTGG